MDTFGIVVEQIGLFVVYILAGVALVKTKVFCAETLEVLAKYVLKLGLPVLIFINTVNGVQRETLFSSAEVIALTAVLYAFFFLESLFLAKVFRLKGNTALVYRAISMFGNRIYGNSDYLKHLSAEWYALYFACDDRGSVCVVDPRCKAHNAGGSRGRI